MVCSNYSCDPNKLVGDHNLIKNGGPWKHIRGISDIRDDISIVFLGVLRKMVRNGSSLLFWDDVWIGDEKLHAVFQG